MIISYCYCYCIKANGIFSTFFLHQETHISHSLFVSQFPIPNPFRFEENKLSSKASWVKMRLRKLIMFFPSIYQRIYEGPGRLLNKKIRYSVFVKFLDLLNIYYTGSSYMSSVVIQDKHDYYIGYA